MRNKSVGTDTAGYFGRFRFYSKITSFDELLVAAETEPDPGFYVFTWGFSKVINNPQVWIGFVSAVYMLGIALLCYWESPDYAFSMLYMYCMGNLFFSMTGLRQAMPAAGNRYGRTVLQSASVIIRPITPCTR